MNKDFRQEKLQIYRDKKRTEEKMIDKIVKMYNLKSKLDLKEIIAIVGDWKGNNRLKNNKSSLGIGMKRLFKKYFKSVYLIDETNTTISERKGL